MLTYSQMTVLQQHLTTGVVKQSEQTDMELTYDLVFQGLLQQVGAARMWVVTKKGAELALRNRLGWKIVTAVSNVLALSTKRRDSVFYALCKF